jgi:hypothetical protein
MLRRICSPGLTALLLSLAVGLGCKPEAQPPPPQEQPRQERFAGTLKSDKGTPLVGKVSINEGSTTTREDGSFELSVPRAEKYVINASAAGHLIHSEVYTGAGVDTLGLALHPAEVFTIDPTKPVDVTDSRGTSVELPAGALVDAQGRPATGPVSMSMHSYDLRTEQMVGDMGGVDVDGKPVVLLSLGAVSVEFSDAAGNEYDLAPGKKARLTMKMDPANDYEGPVPLWWYDTQKGLWIEEGLAIVKDGVASGDVAHFTVWNFDLKFDNPGCIQLKVDPTWFASEGYGFRKPLVVNASVTGQYRRAYNLSIYNTEANALYNLAPDSTVEFRIDGVLYATVKAGGAWGGRRGAPAFPYDGCKGSLTLDGKPPAAMDGLVQGQVLRQYRTNHGGVTVQVDLGGSFLTTTTDAAGNFSLKVPARVMSIKVSKPGYVPAQRTYVSVTAGATLSLPTVMLLAGEVDGDANQCVTPVDTGLIINGLDSTVSSPDDPRDIDGDGKIDYPDLVFAATNGDVCGPLTW